MDNSRATLQWTRRRLLQTTAAVAGGALVSGLLPSSASAAERWGMSDADAAAWAAIEDAANKEGKVTYYTLGTIPEAAAEDVKARFNKDYPNIEFEYLLVGNSAATTSRLLAEQQAGQYVADAFDRSVPGPMQPFVETFIPPASLDPSVQWLDDPNQVQPGLPRGMSHQEATILIGIWYNTKLVKPEDAPKTYADLLDPRWKGQIAWREPWSSGAGVDVYMLYKQLLGPDAAKDWVSKFAQQQAVFDPDQDQILLNVARGEYMIGCGLTGRTGSQLIKQGLPLAISWPTDMVVSRSIGTNILKNCPHPNAAKVFANWMLTQAGQEMYASIGQIPLRKDIAPLEDWMKLPDGAGKIMTSASLDPKAREAQIASARSELTGQ